MKKKLLSIAQIALATAIIAYLIVSIHKSTVRLDLTTPPASIEKDDVYTFANGSVTNRLFAIKSTQNATRLSFHTQTGLSLPTQGILVRSSGAGPKALEWSERESSRYGLIMIRQAISGATQRWPLLLAGVMAFVICLVTVICRWNLLLKAQNLNFSWRRVTILYMVGHFFNLFLIGSTGGDLVKAYLITKEAPEKKTSAVTTIFIDRIIGLLALISLVLVMMLMQLPFFLAHNATRAAMVFNACLFLGAMAGLFLVFRQNVFERWPLFRRLEEKTKLGPLLAKIYSAFHTSFTSSGLVIKTLALSIVNHVALIGSMYCLGLALGIPLPFVSYLAVGPIINAVGAIPLTPGGLGTRDAAAVFLLGALGVSEANALTLTLMLYLAMTFWSLVGGIFYFFYIYQRGERIPKDMSNA